MKKFNFGKLGMIATIVGGIFSIVGGIFGTMDAKETAIETSRDTTIEYLNAATNNQETSEEN